KTFEILPEYSKTKSRGQVNDYHDWGMPIGRRFRALKLWFVLSSFGLEGIRAKLRHHIELNDFFAGAISAAPDFELLTGPVLNFCTFRFSPMSISDEEQLNRLNERLLEAINRSGALFLSHTRIGGKYALRMVIGQTYVEQRH